MELAAALDDMDLLTADDVAKLLKLKVATIYQKVYRRELAVIKINTNCIRFRRSVIKDFIECHAVEAAQPSHSLLIGARGTQGLGRAQALRSLKTNRNIPPLAISPSQEKAKHGNHI